MVTQRSSKRLAERPDLDTKTPQRQRGKDTFEMILATAGELLAEVGFEKLTTNLVCERAGMTPPALYRYFPNKYALLTELAQRLMAEQDAVVDRFMRIEAYNSRTLEDVVAWNIALRKELIRVTRAQPGGLWILRAIRSVPVLQEVRNAARDKVLTVQMGNVAPHYPDVPINTLKAALRLAEQMAFTAIEMLIEDPLLDEDRIVEEVSWMSALYFLNLDKRPPLKLLDFRLED
ncbi:MAG: TetR family transcriptional regulator [Blastomonas sp. CACIA14H2]|uniref:TetR/AcrR family transcriptional regulator n=1 Tax=Blastomonas sp. CACIA14H2 TaxID=1419876 RepID=UPI0003D06A41|nr:MAG: TetR family transcriptional regulator [Blastomonas sp. CACIA14H2]